MAATRILPIVWPTFTLYCSLDVTSRKTATEFWPRGSYATPTSFRSLSMGLSSDVVSSDTNGSRRPEPSYWNTSRLISTLGAVSAAGAGSGGVAAFLGSAAGALGTAGFAAVFGLGRLVACARACAGERLQREATRIEAKEIGRSLFHRRRRDVWRCPCDVGLYLEFSVDE